MSKTGASGGRREPDDYSLRSSWAEVMALKSYRGRREGPTGGVGGGEGGGGGGGLGVAVVTTQSGAAVLSLV